jgi:hypothetical protein
MTTPRIVTFYDPPPIPVRQFDWCAYDDRLGADSPPTAGAAPNRKPSPTSSNASKNKTTDHALRGVAAPLWERSCSEEKP